MAPAFVGNDIGFIRKDKPAGIEYASGKTGPQGHVLGAAWSPDGSRVAFHKVAHGHPNRRPAKDVEPSACLRSSPGRDAAVVLSVRRAVRGRRLRAHARGQHLFVVDAETQNATTLFHEKTRSALGPQWSAKGDEIMFGIGHFGAFFNGFHDLFLGKADRVDGGAQIAMIKP